VGATFDLLAFLAEPHRPASVAVVNRRTEPALASMWYLFADDRFWFHTPDLVDRGKSPFLAAATEGRAVAVMVETFDANGRILKVRATGAAAMAEPDLARVREIYDRYLGHGLQLWTGDWDAQAADVSYRLWTVLAERGSAVDYSGLGDGDVLRWTSPEELDALTTGRRPGG
jgi:hypothetical protein